MRGLKSQSDIGSLDAKQERVMSPSRSEGEAEGRSVTPASPQSAFKTCQAMGEESD